MSCLVFTSTVLFANKTTPGVRDPGLKLRSYAQYNKLNLLLNIQYLFMSYNTVFS